MQFNRTIRTVIPLCSMLLALATVAFQNIENSSKKEKVEQLQLQESAENGMIQETLMLRNN